jgi:nucleoside-diphosphate-sugar epimerase
MAPARNSSKSSGPRRNVLITGATSTIGRQLAEKLMYDPAVDHVIAVARESQPYYFQDFPRDKFAFSQADILKPRELTNLFLNEQFRQFQINTIVHLASQHRPKLERQYSHQLNVLGTKNLMEKAIECGTITMDADAHPSVKDQVDSELLVRTRMDNPVMKIVVLRPTGIIGRNIHSYFNQFFESPVCIKFMGFNPMVNLVHTRDVIRAIQLAIVKDIKGIFNIAGKETAPLTEFAHLCGARIVSLPGPIFSMAQRMQSVLSRGDFDFRVNPERLKYSVLLDTRRAREVLGFDPSYHVKFE